MVLISCFLSILGSVRPIFVVFFFLYLQRPTESQNYKHLCCWCCKSGPITGIIRASKSGFVAGETVVFDFIIQNLSRRVCGVTVLFVKVGYKLCFIHINFVNPVT